LLADALKRRSMLGTSEFYLAAPDMIDLLRLALGELPRPVLSLNRPQTGGSTLVHRVVWRDLIFTCVTRRPLTVA
jgi:hypothetical protein